jgi:hypothetical protein
MRVTFRSGLAGLAGLVLAGTSLLGLTLPGTAMAATTATAETTFSAYPVAGNNGTWANADFDRVAKVSFENVAPSLSDCGTGATECFQYVASTTDTGSYTAIAGAKSPQAGVTETGTPTGPFIGTSIVSFYSTSDDPNGALVPTTATGAGPVSLTDWAEQFFPTGTTFGFQLGVTNYAYSAPQTCENWIDASGVYSNGGLATDGDITGVNHCVSATGPISTFVNSSASCLDNTGASWLAGNGLQIWTCGADGGADQNFRLATYDGVEVLQAVAGPQVSDMPWCVTTPASGTGQLTIQVCNGTSDQVISKSGSYYVFKANGYDMDLKASDTTNGTEVIAYPHNGGKNQQWSLP